jgi:hypothetical protein
MAPLFRRPRIGNDRADPGFASLRPLAARQRNAADVDRLLLRAGLYRSDPLAVFTRDAARSAGLYRTSGAACGAGNFILRVGISVALGPRRWNSAMGATSGLQHAVLHVRRGVLRQFSASPDRARNRIGCASDQGLRPSARYRAFIRGADGSAQMAGSAGGKLVAADIWHLKAEEYYVSVHLRCGRALLRGRLADVIAQLPQVPECRPIAAIGWPATR